LFLQFFEHIYGSFNLYATTLRSINNTNNIVFPHFNLKMRSIFYQWTIRHKFVILNILEHMFIHCKIACDEKYLIRDDILQEDFNVMSLSFNFKKIIFWILIGNSNLWDRFSMRVRNIHLRILRIRITFCVLCFYLSHDFCRVHIVI